MSYATTVGKKGLPSPAVIIAPTHLIASWEPARRVPHGHLQRLQRHAREVTDALKRINSFSFNSIRFLKHGDVDAVAMEHMRAVIQALRATLPLMNGTSAGIFERELARHVGILAPRYFKLKEAAEKKMRELLAVLSFLMDDGPEGDAYEFVPVPRPSTPSGKSVKLHT